MDIEQILTMDVGKSSSCNHRFSHLPSFVFSGYTIRNGSEEGEALLSRRDGHTKKVPPAESLIFHFSLSGNPSFTWGFPQRAVFYFSLSSEPSLV